MPDRTTTEIEERAEEARKAVELIATEMLKEIESADVRHLGPAVERSLDGIALAGAQLRSAVERRLGVRGRITTYEKVRRALGYNADRTSGTRR